MTGGYEVPDAAPARQKANESTMTWGFGSARIKNFFFDKRNGVRECGVSTRRKRLYFAFVLYFAPVTEMLDISRFLWYNVGSGMMGLWVCGSAAGQDSGPIAYATGWDYVAPAELLVCLPMDGQRCFVGSSAAAPTRSPAGRHGNCPRRKPWVLRPG